jgi:hypothetical protein
VESAGLESAGRSTVAEAVSRPGVVDGTPAKAPSGGTVCDVYPFEDSPGATLRLEPSRRLDALHDEGVSVTGVRAAAS